MSDLSRKIEWAIAKFNLAVEEAATTDSDLTAATEENIALLLYVRKIYPGNRFPAWARRSLSHAARAAVEAYEAKHRRSIL